MIDLGGHCLTYHTCLQEAFRSAGISTKFIVPMDCDAPSLPDNWEKSLVFSSETNPFLDLFDRHPSYGKRRIFLLDAYDTENLLDFTNAFTEAASPHDQAWFFLRYNFECYALNGLLHSDLLRNLYKQFYPRILFLTDTTLLQREVEKKLSAPIKLLPVPHTFTPARAPDEERVICWWPGKPRIEKGIDIIQQIVQLPCPEKFLLRLGYIPGIDNIARRIPLEVLPAILSREEYCEAMAMSHILLLPYAQERYAHSSSGIFIEGVVAGKMPVVTDGTWMCHELRRFGLDDLVIDWKNQNLWQHVADLYYNPRLCSQLQLIQAEYCLFHSSANFSLAISKLLL